MKGARPALAALLLAALSLPAPSASAAGTVWDRARRPELERRQELSAEAQGHELKANYLLYGRGMADRADIVAHLAAAALLLEQAGAATSTDLFLRARLASIYSMQNEPKKALALYESITREGPPAPLRTLVFGELAQAYGHLGRTEDEINAYTEALRQQPLARERARLLANRAEAHMLLGDITPAIAGYREALALLSTDSLIFGSGPTTLWGLAVALDRSGDLDSGLDAVRVARSYDPGDKQLNGPGWFFLPDYDRNWYEALGRWQVARKADVPTSVRVDAYGRAVASWETYVADAAPDDKWLPLARVRLKQCEKERAAFLKRPPPSPPRALGGN